MTPEQIASMRSNLLQARLIWISLCFVAPVLFLIGYDAIILNGARAAFLAGFADVPWTAPVVWLSLTVAAIILVAAAILPERLSARVLFRDKSVFHLLKLRHFITCLFLLAVPCLGFMLGSILGPAVASLSLLLTGVPMLAGCALFPNANDWRYRFKLAQEK